MPKHTGASVWPSSLAVVVLAGGRGTRLRPNATTDKGSVRVGGRRLVDIVVDQLPYGTPVAVVSPFPLGRPQVCENPLFGGPAAGIAAGVRALGSVPDGLIGVLSVDAPDSPRLLPALADALLAQRFSDGVTPHPSAAVARAADGWVQPLCAVWHRADLETALRALDARHGGAHNVSARRLLRAAPGGIVSIVGHGAERDYDTADELRSYAAGAPVALA